MAAFTQDYEMPWRPTFEWYSCLGWGGGALASGLISITSTLPSGPFYYMGGFCAVMTGLQAWQARGHAEIKNSLIGHELEFESLDALYKRVQSDTTGKGLWLGYGFEWGQKHAQRVYEITKRALEPEISKQVKKTFKTPQVGKTWIHGVEPKEHEIDVPLKHLDGHSIAFGTTGSGKTRLFDLIISQAIFRNETCFIIDPKGDQDLWKNAFRACQLAGRPEAFVHFNPAFPEMSYRIDPLKNWNRPTEVASRIKDLIVSDSDNDPFAQFSWNAINNIVQGLVATGVRPNFKRLRKYIEGGPASLLRRALKNHFDDHAKGWQSAIGGKLNKAKDGETETKIMVQYYREFVSERHPSQALDGLCRMFEHERAHFSKMTASLEPILNQLTAGELGDLLSPDPDDQTDHRPITDSARMINKGQVVYCGLDSLTDSTIGSALGSIFLADLTSVAGDRYNYGVDNRPVNLIVDEAAEVVNGPLIQLMNKGRGAGFRIMIASQTFADFSARLGNESRARQVIGNANNLIGLRTKDGETQEFICEPLGDTVVRQIMHTQNTTAIDSEKNPASFSGGYGERLIETDMPLFAQNLLGNLPNLEYIASVSGGRIYKGRIPIITSDIEMGLDDQPWIKNRHADDF